MTVVLNMHKTSMCHVSLMYTPSSKELPKCLIFLEILPFKISDLYYFLCTGGLFMVLAC